MTCSLGACSSSTLWLDVPYQSLLTDVGLLEYRLTAQPGTPLVFDLAVVENRTGKRLRVRNVSLPAGSNFELIDARTVGLQEASLNSLGELLSRIASLPPASGAVLEPGDRLKFVLGLIVSPFDETRSGFDRLILEFDTPWRRRVEFPIGLVVCHGDPGQLCE